MFLAYSKKEGQNLMRRPPTEFSFQPPLTSVCFAPLPIPFLLVSPLEFPEFPSAAHLRNSFWRVSIKTISDGPSSRGFAFQYSPPPPLALPSDMQLQFLALGTIIFLMQFGSGQKVCFGPSRPDPGRIAQAQDGIRTAGWPPPRDLDGSETL